MPRVGNWKKYYSQRCMSAKDALLKIRSGSRVFLSPGCGEPQHLLEELVKLGGADRRLNDVEVVHMLTVGEAKHAQKRYDRNFRHNSLFVGPGVRSAIYEGLADYTPIFLSEIPGLFRSGRMHLDAALVQVTPPDNFGFCSLGVSVEAVKAAAESAELVAGHWMLDVNKNIAEVAFSVADEYQRKGIGTHLLRFLMRIAREQGIKGFSATVIAGNTGMMRVFQKSGCVLHTEYDSGVISLSFRFDEKAESQ